jgi:hypothetical protein
MTQEKHVVTCSISHQTQVLFATKIDVACLKS